VSAGGRMYETGTPEREDGREMRRSLILYDIHNRMSNIRRYSQ